MKLIGFAAVTVAVLVCGAVRAQPAPSVTPAMLHIPEGTKVSIRLEDNLSSQSSVTGDRFTISSIDPVVLPNGTLPGGLTGVGEITGAHKKGMMGKGGELNVRLDYLKLGSTRIPLRGSGGGAGGNATGSTVALTVLFGPVGLLKHGHDMEIPKGTRFDAVVDQDVDVALPLGAGAEVAPGAQ